MAYEIETVRRPIIHPSIHPSVSISNGVRIPASGRVLAYVSLWRPSIGSGGGGR